MSNDGYKGNSISIRLKLLAAPGDSAPSVQTIFLSSTIGDLEDYRREIQDVLLIRARAACFLSEDWINDYQSAVTKCRAEINRADGYIGVFGYYYGSIPPPHTPRSITHLEFDWAKEKWQNAVHRPIAVFMPKKPSRAEKSLKTKADACLNSKNQAERETHDASLKTFHAEVSGSWQTVNWFEDVKELREKVIVTCLQWQGLRPANIGTNAIEVVETNSAARKVTDEELGLLGRENQFDAVRKIINQAARFNAVPAVAFVAYGDKFAGQTAFLRALTKIKPLVKGRPPKVGRLPDGQYDLTALIQWTGDMIGVSPGGEIADLKQLAALVHAELERQQLCVVLDQIRRFAGGVTAFYEMFWKDFYAELEDLRRRKPVANRLIFVVVAYADDAQNWIAAAGEFDQPNAAAETYEKLLLLPKLAAFTAGDVFDWFATVEISDDANGRRNHLAETILQDEQGGEDGTPLLVFERLRNENLWNE